MNSRLEFIQLSVISGCHQQYIVTTRSVFLLPPDSSLLTPVSCLLTPVY